MRNEPFDINESTTTFETQLLNNHVQNIKNTQPQCRYLRPCVEVCMSEKCIKQAFVCSDTQCHCRKQHQMCIKINILNLIPNIQKKIVSIESLEKCIFQNIQQMVNSLSKFSEETVSKMRKDFEYFGLNHHERDFLTNIKSGNLQSITGGKIWEIIHSKQNRQSILQSIKWTQQRLQNHFHLINEQHQKIFKSIQTKIMACNQKVQSLLQRPKFIFSESPNNISLKQFLVSSMDSKIIQSIDQVEKLLYFFYPKVVKSFKLLYRASENQFLTDKFYQKCKEKQKTLVIVQNQNNKKFGGYTPLQWKCEQYKYIEDKSGESFLFSLTNGEKFILKDKNCAILRSQVKQMGPNFGSDRDLYICNKANQSNDSQVKINNSYSNENYDSNSNTGLMEFIGKQQSPCFRVKQWQVWKVQFQQNQ